MALLKRQTSQDRTVVGRSWGEEDWICNSELYCGKRLIIDPGKRGSMHFHLKKHETMYVASGRLTIEMIDPETTARYSHVLRPGESIVIPQGQVHSLVNYDDQEAVVMFEFSTKHEESDSYRVEKAGVVERSLKKGKK